jgi:acyl-coenzyme A synthetase/AMP-(fatty) acid ligase
MSGETGQRGTLRERVDAAIDALTHEEIPTELSRSRVPRDLIYVDELPRTATGKVTRQTIDELTARYAQASSAAVEA